MPSGELIAAVRVGDHVKAMFRGRPPSNKYDCERMWVRIESISAAEFVGALVNQPSDMPSLVMGCNIRMPKSHVIAVELGDPNRTPQDAKDDRDYWDRCIVDQCVLDGQVKVGYLYREVPDTRSGDKFPDSGWRIRGDMRGLSGVEIDARKAAYIALGAVLNKDDSWLPLIDEPVGSRFNKDFEKGIFLREA